MSEETSPLPAGPVCAWEGCGLPVPESRGTKPRRYCKRSCRQRAYEARRRREEIAAAVGAAVIRERTARSASKNVTVTPARAAEERHSDSRAPLAAPAPSAPVAPAARIRLARRGG